ncbi:hypothetical protein G9A89_022823 [Geosiphon pyriformis]|nr:hypothetical protein G9A89_022823 [Geosiphon pyriformis]
MRDVACEVVAFFSKIGLGVDIKAIVLTLECILLLCSVMFYLNSQMALNACVLEIKIKKHLDIVDNNHVDALTHAVVHLDLVLLAGVSNKFFVTDGLIVSGNVHHFICDIYCTCVDWECTASVWYPNFHMLIGFTNRKLAVLHTYLIKTVHRKLPVAVCKRLYNKCYPSVLCLMCGDIEFSNHAFMYSTNVVMYSEVVSSYIDLWKSLVSNCLPVLSLVLLTLIEASDGVVYTKLYKDFVFVDWVKKAISVFGNRKKAMLIVIDFVYYLTKDYCSRAWLLKSKFRIIMEKSGLVCVTDRVFALLHGLPSWLSEGVVYMLGIIELFAVSFGSRRESLFFSGLDNDNRVFVSV